MTNHNWYDIFSNLGRNAFESSQSSFNDITRWIIFFVMVSLVIFVIYRYTRLHSLHPVGEYIGIYKFMIQGKTIVTGHLAKSNFQLDERTIKKLEQIKDIDDEAKNALQKLVTNGKINVYNFKQIGFEKDNIIQSSKKNIVLARVELDDNKYFKQDIKGDFSIISPSLRIYTRNVLCMMGTDTTQITDHNGDLINVYMLVVLPNKPDEKIKAILPDNEYNITVHDWGHYDVAILGKLVTSLPVLQQLWERIEPSENETERLREKNNELQLKNTSIFKDMETLKHLASMKAMIGGQIPVIPKQGIGSTWGWKLIYFIAGVSGSQIIPSIPYLSFLGIWGGGLLSLIVIIVINYLITPKKHEAKEDDET